MKKSVLKKAFCPLLSLLLMLGCLLSVSCGPTGGAEGEKPPVQDPILESEEGDLPLAFYEFLLSRMKGSLARSGYAVNDSSFWTSITESGESYEDYYNRAVLNSCKNYLAASILFQREGLTLPQSVLASIEEEVNFYIDYDGKKDVGKFNEILAPFGVDSEGLKQVYITEAKYEYLLDHLYGGGSLIGENVKEDYYKEHYVRFKQVLFSKFYYEYETDPAGDIIYFDPEEGVPLYDKENGTFVYDANGNYIRDEYGEVIYYDLDGNRLYDKVNGRKSVKLNDDGEGIRYDRSPEELMILKAEAETLKDSLVFGNTAEFEAAIAKHTDVDSESAYPDGFYLSQLEASGYDAYMTAILEKTEQMQVGEVAVIETEYGYHVVMKYELDTGKYSDTAYGEWFTNFNASLINKLFLDKCEDLLADIAENEENLAKASSIKDIGINFDY